MKKALIITLICLLMASNIAFPSQAVAGSAEKTTVVIGFKDHIDKNLVTSLGGEIKREYSSIPAISASLPRQAIDALAKNPKIAYIDNNIQFTAINPADAELTYSWGVNHIGAGTVQASGNTGSGINVAVIDTGINMGHVDLVDRYKGGRNFVADGLPIDDNGHGTHCAGIIAATDNNNAVVGVAPKANIYAVKVLDSSGSGSLENVIAGIDWATSTWLDSDLTNNIQVISMSLGAPTGEDSLEAACDAAYLKGILVVAASGNDYMSSVSYPANYDSVIAVGATDRYDRRASFSNYGSKLELVAPGVSILSDYIDTNPNDNLNQDTWTMSGTSMACPHVAGVAALIFASKIDQAFDANNNGVWDNTEVRNKLDSTAKDLGTAGRDIYYGYGLVDAIKATTPTPPSMHVESITMAIPSSQNYAIATITICDGSNNLVNGAKVTAQWSGAASDRDTAITDLNGIATVQSNSARRATATFTVTVASVQLAGYTFVPSSADSKTVTK